MCNLCNRYRSGGAAEPPLDMRKLSPSMSTRLWNIVFPLGYPLLAIFSLSHLFPLPLSLGLLFPLLFGWRLTIPNSDARIAHSLRPVSPRIRKRTEIRGRRRRISFTVNVPWSWKSRGSTCLYRCGASGYMSGLSGGSRKEHRFSVITGFELRFCPFKYSRDEYFLILAFGSTT